MRQALLRADPPQPRYLNTVHSREQPNHLVTGGSVTGWHITDRPSPTHLLVLDAELDVGPVMQEVGQR